MMTSFLLLVIILVVILISITGFRILFNELFWLFLMWGLIFGIHMFSGVSWKYSMSIWLIVFVGLSFIAFLIGRKHGKNRRVKLFFRETSSKDTRCFITLGISGALLFAIDYIRLNGLFTAKSGYDISIIGSVGALLVPILLVEGLYIFAKTLVDSNRISFKGILLLIGYSIPCILNSGRESLLFIIIGVMSIYGYNAYFFQKYWRIIRPKKIIKTILIVFAVFFAMWFMVHISKERFGSNEISTFLNSHNITAESRAEAKKWGDFEFLYYNIASYFSHQVSFLEFMLEEYKGPYLFGLYELNIISRRLPNFLGLDYQLVTQQLRQLFFLNGVSYSGDWFTVLGSFMVDFGRIGTVVMCYICGFCVGKIRKKIELTFDIRYAILLAIVCICMFSSIQLGPFYNTLIYGAFIWWWLIFRKDEGTIR
ncbi:O-antigen polymerase [Mediterraneibacter gnavus]|uniref:O-antigen polymerase n=2 Tax=Mediterraneibacter gnavus TaxID=33038 RepID=UPI000C7DAB65|nr:hypothetical protein CCY17_10995 [Mediterraneibacter gnavus]